MQRKWLGILHAETGRLTSAVPLAIIVNDAPQLNIGGDLLTPEQAANAVKKYGSQKAAAEALNIPRTTFRRALGKVEDKTTGGCKTDFSANVGTVDITSKSIRTVADALTYAEIDPDIWEVDRAVINKWDMGYVDDDKQANTQPLYQVKVWLKRRANNTIEAALERVASMFRDAPAFPPVKRADNDDHLLFLGLHDAHFGLLAWQPETGQNYDLKKAYQLYVDASARLLNKASGWGIGKIVIPVGQDMFHTQRPDNKTPRHENTLDVDSRLIKINQYGYAAALAVGLLCREIAPTEYVYVPGNHDPEASWWLAHSLSQYFRKCPDVFVDTGPKTRKYRQHGKCLIGMTHGIDEKAKALPILMPAECRDVWSQVKYCEMLTGHKHAKASWHYQETESMPGIRVRVLPSLAGHDAWHFSKGYVHAGRAADAYLYHKEYGNVARLSCGVDEIA